MKARQLSQRRNQRDPRGLPDLLNGAPPKVPGQSATLSALTVAALSLPGLMLSPAPADAQETVDFQYGHYQEDNRSLYGANGEQLKSKYDPIEADSLFGSVHLDLTDQLQGDLNFSQDTWSGATPIATAPSVAGGNNPTGIDGVSGASPYVISGMLMDAEFRPLSVTTDDEGQVVVQGVDRQLVHTMSSASPETRKQVDFLLTRDLDDETAISVGGGVSNEDDFKSGFGNIGANRDFNQKLTNVSAGLSYTHSNIDATLDHDASPYIYGISDFKGNNIYNASHSSSEIKDGEYSPIVEGNRDDWGSYVGVTQVLNKNAQMEVSLGYTYSDGYLSNPYKLVEVAFIDPAQQFGTAGGYVDAPYTYDAQVYAVLEERPEERNLGTLDMRYVHYIEATNAALHLDYSFFDDDWGIRAHTLELQWAQPVGDSWTVTPRVRYYTQDAADFYTPYLVTQQGLLNYVTDPVNGPIYISASTPNDGHKYYEDPTFTVEAPIDPNTGMPVIGWNTGAAVIEQATGQPVSDQSIVDSLMQDFNIFDRGMLPEHYSSDHRLSGFGSLGGGVTVSREFTRGVTLELSYEYVSHAGSLKMGGGGEGDYADFNYYMVNAALVFDLNAAARVRDNAVNRYAAAASHREHEGDSKGVHGHHASRAPAGVALDHMLGTAGDFMVGYRFMYSRQAGDMQHGSNTVDDETVVNNGCDGNPCYVAPSEMRMYMNMLDLMYAPTDWLNLMLMPQFVDMDMSMEPLDGAPLNDDGMGPIGSAIMHSSEEHSTGAVGDTGAYALFRIFDGNGQHLHLGLGVTAPTGDVEITQRDMHQQAMGYIHYGMQIGSGTWDFKPSVTYTGHSDALAWGAQLNATTRLENSNDAGFALGDEVQSTAWGSYTLADGLAASVRGLYTNQDSLEGGYDRNVPAGIGPMDYTNNYGGRFWDVGIGLDYVVPAGRLAGNQLKIEWLEPVKDHVSGYQLEREGTLVFNWSLAF